MILHDLRLTPSKKSNSVEQTSTSSKRPNNSEKLRQDTQPSFSQFKSTQKMNPENTTSLVFQPSKLYKVLMIPFPFLMVGCCMSKTTILQFNSEKKILSITIYPGLFSCCKKEYEIAFEDIMASKILVAFNHRINKRQAYRLYLETRIGDFQLTAPRPRDDILESQNSLDALLKVNGVWNR